MPSPNCPHCFSSSTSFKAKALLWECNSCEERFKDPSVNKLDPQTIFLSYAHKSERDEDYDISEDLVWLIKGELEKDGHVVWIDHEGIRGGTQWRERITDAITSHKHFLAFLSKRSVRQEPNVCLNEVAIAIKHNRIIQTLLTEPESQVSAPLTLSSIQWHKFSDWKEIKEGKKSGPKGEDWDTWFGSLMASVRQNLEDINHQKAIGELSELKEILKPASFDAAIIKSVEGFFGRQWLFDAVQNWLQTDSRLFWLKGTPGIGKSAFAAKLVHSGSSSIVGFFKCDFQALKSAEESASECIRTLAYQLASRLPDYRIKLLRGQQIDRETIQKKTADDLFSYLITEPLNRAEKIAEANRLALVIDALDEAGRLMGGKMVNPLADLLYKNADQLPPWLGVIVTSRPEAYLQQQLGAKFSPLIMEGGTQNNLSDIKDYLETKLDPSIAGEKREKNIASIIDKSGGTFLYIMRIESSYNLSKPESLPNGLDDLFYKDFERYFPELRVYEEKTEKFLRLLVASPGPLPKVLAQELLQWQARDITQYVTQPLASLLAETDDGLQFFHKSIKDWLQDGVRSGNYQVNDTGSKELGDFLWDEFSRGQPTEEITEDKEKNQDRAQGKESPKIIQSSWEKQIINWLSQLLPSTKHWQDRANLYKLSEYLHTKLKYHNELILRQQHLKLTEKSFGSRGDEVAKCFNDLGNLASDLGMYEAAENFYIADLKITESLYGPEHPKTAVSLNNLGLLLLTIGQYEKAETIQRKSLKIQEVTIDCDKANLAEALNNLAMLLTELGRYEEAESLYRRALELKEKLLGLNDPRTAISIGNLGSLLGDLGRYDEAESLLRQALLIKQEILGPDHPSTAASLNNLANVLRDLGRYEDAKCMYMQSIDIKERILGIDHPNLASSLNGLGLVLRDLGLYAEAESAHEKALEINQKVFGKFHTETAATLNNLAMALDSSGNKIKAELLYRESIEIKEKILDSGHPDIAGTFNNLASVLCDLERYDEAESLYRKSILNIERALGAEHPNLAISLDNLGNLLLNLERYDDAELHYRRALQINEESLGLEHPDTCISLENLGNLMKDIGLLEEAKIFYKRACSAREKIHGSDHLIVASSINNLAKIERDLDNYNEAENLYRRAILIREQKLGSEHPTTLVTLTNLAGLLNIVNRHNEAELIYRNVIKVREKTLGTDHPKLGSDLYSLANTLKNQNRIDESKEFYLREIELIEKNEGENSQSLVISYRVLGSMLCNVGRLNEAQPYLEKALMLAEMHQEEYGELINAELYAMGKLKLLQEEFEAAEGYLLRCLKIEEAIGDPDDIKITKDKFIELYHSWGRPEMAELYRG